MGEYNAHYTTARWLAAESEVAQLQIEEDMRTILGVGNRRMQQCGLMRSRATATTNAGATEFS